MRWICHNGMHYLQFSHLAKIKGLRHGILLKFNENHRRTHEPFNLGLGGGDSDARVWERRRQIGRHFGLATLVFARQVHGNSVMIWNGEANPQKLGQGRDFAYLPGDALATAVAGQALFIQTADCQSVLIADPNTRTVANVHSGWRGSIGNIIAHTVSTLVDRFGCKAKNMRCGIGPSLGPCCSEFVNYRNEIPERLWKYKLSNDHFDFWRMSMDQLTNAGVRKENVENCNICTRCNQHLFFSYRGGDQAGRFASVIGFQQ